MRLTRPSPWLAALLAATLATPQILLYAQAKPAQAKPAARQPSRRPGPTPTPAGRGRSRSAVAPRSGTSRRSKAGPTRRRSSRGRPCRSTPTGAKEPALGTIKIEGDTQVAVDDRVVRLDIPHHRVQLQDAGAGRQVKALVADVQALPQQPARARPRSAARLRRRQPAAGEERRGHQGRSAHRVLGGGAGDADQPRRRPDLEPDQGRRPPVRRQHQLGPVRARAEQDRVYVRYNDSWLQATDVDGPWTAVRASCPTASRSCPPTTTGRT